MKRAANSVRTAGRAGPVGRRPPAYPKHALAISILAGGLSQRMGRDKTALRIGRRSLLNMVRRTALEMGWPVRVIRRDLVRRCGPLGGIHAALTTTRADAEMFLACDMPFVSVIWLRKVSRAHRSGALPVFSGLHGVPGFPCLLPRSALRVVETQMATGDYSLRGLAVRLKAVLLDAPSRYETQLFNINTPEDWESARRRHETK